ncbi:MAG: alanine--glyoxylate aminotransferase [Dehalococcoidales bacterium]|nr:alanine--glyoxylate aminotransferase [Dehalococcoidales bacterium]MDP6576631.1 alanine--glyoxylate aminotransferase family protein [Dehalococcoidales bacterium]MDP6825401.1 alanine--glyoxylate aminotransferase family protein [Dehalococcoidales bacterium]
MSDVSFQELKPPPRILLGPGPSNISPRVQMAMTQPMLGHMDPYFTTIVADAVKLLRFLFRTENEITFPISATGMAGMDASFNNFLESGDVVVIGVNGFFGERMVDIASRCGAEVVRLDVEWGRIVESEAIEAALKSRKRVKLLALVHAETSTGVLQPLAEASRLAKQYGALLLVDAVTSLGGHELAVDDWGIDICYSGSQKCIGCPPGLSPFTASKAAQDILERRASKTPTFALDISMLARYWVPRDSRFYHHTVPICMLYALHEALVQIVEEGLEARIQRHLRHGTALQAGLEAMGLTLHAQAGHRLSTLTTVGIPSGVDDLRVRQRLLNEFGIEIGGGLGSLKGQVWRVGLMGYSSTAENVLLFLSVLEKLLVEEGHSLLAGAGVVAAVQRLR